MFTSMIDWCPRLPKEREARPDSEEMCVIDWRPRLPKEREARPDSEEMRDRLAPETT